MVSIVITRGLRTIRLARGVGNEKNALSNARFARFSLGSDSAVLLHTPTRFIVHTQIKSALNCKSSPTTPTSTSVLR